MMSVAPDLEKLEQLLQNLAFSKLDWSDMERMGDSHFVKLFRLAQLSIEYLVFTQNYMQTMAETLALNYQESQSATIKLRD